MNGELTDVVREKYAAVTTSGLSSENRGVRVVAEKPATAGSACCTPALEGSAARCTPKPDTAPIA